MRPMQIVADENIPFAREVFAAFGEVDLCSGRGIDAARIEKADALLVRSVTRVDRALLEGSTVQFVGTATIGTDHVDTAWLAENDIAFASAPGSNADSVVEYVLSSLLWLSHSLDEPLADKTVGVVGCGQIGGRLARRLPRFGCRVLLNDPPLRAAAERDGRDHAFRPLDDLVAEADVLTFHVPLVREGPFRTVHLFGGEQMGRMRPGAWLLNTSRGPVVDNSALVQALAGGRPAAAVLDVWEGEPEPDPRLIREVAIGTPHIAGYSFDGKLNGTRMLYEALALHASLPTAWDDAAVQASGGPEEARLVAPDKEDADWLWQVVRQMYDVTEDDRRFRQVLNTPSPERSAAFQMLRRSYPIRRTFSWHTMRRTDVPMHLQQAVFGGLNISPAEEHGAAART